MRIEKGQIIKTNYDTGPYEVINVTRGCVCPNYHDVIEMLDPPASLPHIHLVVRGLEGHNRGHIGWLSGFDEETLKSVWSSDELIICKNLHPVQQTLV